LNYHRSALDEEITKQKWRKPSTALMRLVHRDPLAKLVQYKLLFQEIPGIFMVAINQLDFNKELSSEC
jgi:hypothetical protein